MAFLKLEIKNAGDVPRLYLNNKEIKGKERISISWETATTDPSKTRVKINYIDDSNNELPIFREYIHVIE